jgi:hypothetical protein
MFFFPPQDYLLNLAEEKGPRFRQRKSGVGFFVTPLELTDF